LPSESADRVQDQWVILRDRQISSLSPVQRFDTAVWVTWRTLGL